MRDLCKGQKINKKRLGSSKLWIVDLLMVFVCLSCVKGGECSGLLYPFGLMEAEWDRR